MDVIIWNLETEDQQKRNKFREYVLYRKPERIIVVPGARDQGNNKMISGINSIFGNTLKIAVIEYDQITENSSEDEDIEVAIKEKILDLGLQSVRDYVSDYMEDEDSLNSEITYTLYRAYFKFYSAALKENYERLYERKRKYFLSKIAEMNPSNKDLIITTEEDAYWYIDH
ncbi:MAG: hypothetical protein ACYDAO_04125 [Thermoplasmataceae archaeon]